MTTPQSVALDLAKSGEAVKSGPIGFAVILVLCVACYFLFKSMAKHLRKVREEFPADGPAESQAGDDAVSPPRAETAPRPDPAETQAHEHNGGS